MGDLNRSRRDDAIAASEQFLELVMDGVDFGGQLPAVRELRSDIVRLTITGKTEEAQQLLMANSSMTTSAASEFVEFIGTVADRVHYSTGLRP